VLKLVCYAPFLQWSVQLQIVLSIRLLCSLPTTVCNTVRNIEHQVAMLPSFTVQLQIVLSIRSLCSLPTTVYNTVSNIVCQVAVLPSYNSKAIVSLQIVYQVALLPSYNSKATVSSLCSLPVPILFQFILIYLNFF